MTSKVSTARLKVSAEGTKGVAGQLDQVGKATERVGRAQTRLGQASASTGRQFAAQASGLGGLVAAYAGAAATVFALQAAFDALNKAARAETIISGTKALALEIGQSGPRILKEVKAITQGQIELSEAAQNINIALSAGFNTEQISRLTKVSLGASRALGRNLTDALQRVVRGAAKLEPELLDELGIFTRIDPAVNKYAQRLGVAATTLTDFERRQAFVNAVITEGERKFSAIDTTSKSTQKTLEQLQTQLQELALEFGGIIANALQPLISFFKNNVGNTLLLFGGILALVFGKATEIVGNFAKNSINNLSDFAAKYADSAAKAKGATDTIIKGQKDLNAVLAKRKGGLGGEAAFTQGLTRDLSSEAAAARRRFLSGEDLDPRQRAKDTQVLTQAQDKLAAAGRKNSAAYDDAGKILKTYAAAEETAGGKARFLTAASVKLQGAIKGVAAAAALAGKALNLAFIAVGIAQLAGSLFDVDLIGMLTDAFKDLSQRTEDVRNGLVGLTVAAAGGGNALGEAIKRITDREEVLESIPEKIRDISNEIENAAKKDVEVLYSRTTIELQRQEEATKLLKEAQDDLAKSRRKNDAEGIEDAKVQIEIIEAVIKRINLFSAELIGLAGELQRSTGLSGDRVADSFRAGALGVEELNGRLFIAGVEIDKINGKFTTSDLPDAQQQAVDAQIIFNSVLKETNEALAAGALNSDKLSAKIAGLTTQILEIEEKGGLSNISPGPGAVQDATKLREEIEKLRDLQVELKALETTSKGIAKAFSSAFTALDTAPFKGLIDLSGKLADNSQRAAENQSKFIRSLIERNKARLADPSTDPALRPQLEESLNLAIKASAGSILEYFQTAKKVVETEKVKAQQLDKQLQTLKDQQEVQKLQRDNTRQIEVEKQLRDAAKARFDIAEKQLENRKQQASLAQKDLDLALKLAQATARNAAASNKLAATQRGTGAQADESARVMNLSILANQLEILNEKSFKDQTVINAKRREIIELERQYAEERFTEQKSLIEKELKESLELLSVQKEIEKSRLEGLKQEKTTLEQFNQDQLALFDRQSALETQKLTDQKAQLERERKIALTRASAQLKASEADEKIFNQQSQNTINQLKGFKNFTETINTFVLATGPDSPFVQAVATILDVATDGAAGAALRDNLATIPQQTTAALDEAIALSQGNINKQVEIFKLQRDGITDQALGESNLNNLKQTGITAQIENQEKLRVLERDILSQSLAGKVKELETEILIQQERLKGLSIEELQQKADATQKIEQLEQQRNRTLQELNQRIDAVARSEDRLGQALDQSQSIVKDSVTGAFMKLNDALIDGSITMGMVGNTFRDMVGNMLREIQQAVFRKTIVDPLSTAIAGSIPGLGSLFGGGVKTAAAGGAVHMAGGGMKRDRVPAMLEPGEFVMRKDAVKQFGVDTMMRMNAAPRGFSAGGGASNRGKLPGASPDIIARAMEIQARHPDADPSLVIGIAEAERDRAKTLGATSFFHSNAVLDTMIGRNKMKGDRSKSIFRDPRPFDFDALKGNINKGIKAQEGLRSKTQGTLTPGDLSRMIEADKTPGPVQTAGFMDILTGSKSKTKKGSKSLKDRVFDAIKNIYNFERNPQDLKNRFNKKTADASLGNTGAGTVVDASITRTDVGSIVENMTTQQMEAALGRRSSAAMQSRSLTQNIANMARIATADAGMQVGISAKEGRERDRAIMFTQAESRKASEEVIRQSIGDFRTARGLDEMEALAAKVNPETIAAATLKTNLAQRNADGTVTFSRTPKTNPFGNRFDRTLDSTSADEFLGAPSGSVNQFELQNAITNRAIQDATFDPRGDLASVLGADGFRGFPLSIVGALLGLDVPNIFARAPTPASLSARKARSVVRQRTGTQATGYKGTFQRGDITTSGNFMTETADGIISGIDPFALDKLGYSGSIAATMGGGMGFRAQGSDIEFGSLRGGISAALTPGRQSAITVEEYNAMSRKSREAHSPGLGGDRALSPGQRMQMNIYGAYANTPARDGTPRGFTIPRDPITGKHTFSGTIKSISDSEGVAMGGGDFSGYADSGLTQDDVMAGGFVLASGGLVRKMAAGGAVRSRDRVPALLEPGEFVIRRPMAKAIGGSALNQMNATGKNLTPPNIEVNLNNQGAPKNVSAAAPRVQGDKIIIDMITRDLRNNGPIKKSLRK